MRQSSTDHPASLAVLCGGRSSRLGTDKGLFQPLGDESLVMRALRLWGHDFAELLVVVRSPAQAALYRQALDGAGLTRPVRIVHDEGAALYAPQAAISGIHTALCHSSFASTVCVPVDQLGVRALHLRPLLKHAGGRRPAAYAEAGDDCLPFPSLWPASAREPVAALMAANACSVRGALQDLRAERLPLGDESADLACNGNTRADLQEYFGAPLFDPFKRRLHYLRFSLTEACNLSCTYCLPAGFPEWYKHKARLDEPAIAALLAGFRALGFRKVRFTGGEPTVHPGCLKAVRLARRLGYEQIALTTNGLLMSDLAPWLAAGLTDLNVSLDSLSPELFAAVTKSRDVARVRQLIETAAASPLQVKVNTVLMRSLNGRTDAIDELIDWALDLPITLRFIELMDTGLNSGFAAAERVLGSELVPRLTSRGLQATVALPGALDLRGPASDYAHPLRPGRIGLINPLSCNFCSKCNRLRITAKGRLKLCLFGDEDLPLDLSSPAAVALNVRQLIDRKPERHYLNEGHFGNVATFRTIGG